MYTQRVHVEYSDASPLDYEGEPHRWHLEYSDAGIPYLRLEDFRFCGMNPEIPCQVTDGGGYDICRDQWVEMQGEGILILLGTNKPSDPPEEQVYYYLHYPMGSENSWDYARHDK